MLEKIYLHLLIFCVILCQGIIATLSDENIYKESLDFLVRKRRVISQLGRGRTPMPIEQVNYVVNIKKNNRAVCVGVILSNIKIIAPALCFESTLRNYCILSGSGYIHRSSSHNATSKLVYYGNLPHEDFDGIALITVDPPFEFSPRTGSIKLYSGFISTGNQATVCGWGCVYPLQPSPVTGPRRLRSITLPIMSHGECQNLYRVHFSVTEKHICTYDERQYCARGDLGAPLVVNNRLAGIHIWKGEVQGQRNPDVFIGLHRDDYRTWIMENIYLI